jgi:alcohol dehydrogenase
MKVPVYHGAGVKARGEVARPELIADTDSIVRVDTVGTVAKIGTAVKSIAVGDRGFVSRVSACGGCQCCREARFGQCTGGGGWILGDEIDDTQAEYGFDDFIEASDVFSRAGETGALEVILSNGQ